MKNEAAKKKTIRTNEKIQKFFLFLFYLLPTERKKKQNLQEAEKHTHTHNQKLEEKNFLTQQKSTLASIYFLHLSLIVASTQGNFSPLLFSLLFIRPLCP